jgi:protein-S-isoprenylcysteine O-methyltransferase Ste14
VDDGAPNPALDRSSDLSRLARYAYIAGLAGASVVVGMGFLAARRGVLDSGWGITSGTSPNVDRSIALVLVVAAATMFAIEFGVRAKVEGKSLIAVSPLVTERRYGEFFHLAFGIYVIELGLLSLAIGIPASFFARLGLHVTEPFGGFYRTAAEYGFRKDALGYYRPWFSVMDTFWYAYLFAGLPYVLVTRALQHAPNSDTKQAAFTVMKLARRVRARLDGGDLRTIPAIDRYDRSAILGLVVKVFYVPLMTVFFADQFTHVVNNFSWMTGPKFVLANVNMRDVFNVSQSIIFAVDVGVAWGGYVVSSRWVKNTTFSAEGTVEGWVVALLCYPPIGHVLGNYYSSPAEDALLKINDPLLATVFAGCAIVSFTAYTSATIMFGLRFSNLTNRGIITRGPYAWVRHPAYAAKNFSWWCLMLPYVIYEGTTQRSLTPLLQIIGMFIMTGIYYRRAITEERHLSHDEEYVAYTKKVRHRFIPGFL